MKRVLALAGILGLAFTMSACGNETGAVGTWGDGYKADKQPYLQLALAAEQNNDSAGYLTGSDGCNRIQGQWLYQGGKLTFPQISATQLKCDGVDTWLSKAASATLDNNTLVLHDSAGKDIGSLDRRDS